MKFTLILFCNLIGYPYYVDGSSQTMSFAVASKSKIERIPIYGLSRTNIRSKEGVKVHTILVKYHNRFSRTILVDDKSLYYLIHEKDVIGIMVYRLPPTP